MTQQRNLFAATRRVNQLSFPMPRKEQRPPYRFKGFGEDGRQQFVTDPPSRLIGCPAVDTFSALIPIDDAVLFIADKYGFIGLIQELCLAHERLRGAPELRDVP